MSSTDRCDAILRLIDQTLDEYTSLTKPPRRVPSRAEPPLPLCEASPRRLLPASFYGMGRDRTRK